MLKVRSPSGMVQKTKHFSNRKFMLKVSSRVPTMGGTSRQVTHSTLGSLSVTSLSAQIQRTVTIGAGEVADSFTLRDARGVVGRRDMRDAVEVSSRSLAGLTIGIKGTATTNIGGVRDEPMCLNAAQLSQRLPGKTIPGV